LWSTYTTAKGTADLVEAEHLELHPRHRGGGVLEEDLVRVDDDVGPGDQLAVDQVGAEQFPGEVLRRHCGSSGSRSQC
jgi:hypothetical protein